MLRIELGKNVMYLITAVLFASILFQFTPIIVAIQFIFLVFSWLVTK